MIYFQSILLFITSHTLSGTLSDYIQERIEQYYGWVLP
jgi:hypothetical protein